MTTILERVFLRAMREGRPLADVVKETVPMLLEVAQKQSAQWTGEPSLPHRPELLSFLAAVGDIGELARWMLDVRDKIDLADSTPKGGVN